VPDDPRWIGCWWLGYIVVAVGLLATSVPLWFFPSSMITEPKPPQQQQQQDHAANHCHSPAAEDARANAHHAAPPYGSCSKSIGRKLRKEVKGKTRR